MKFHECKIIQIMPAPFNMQIVYDCDGKDHIRSVVCLALAENDDGERDIFILDVRSDGVIDCATAASNFKEIRYNELYI